MKEFNAIFGNGFRFKKINGYYNLFSHSIVEHILNAKSVKQTITKYGFYYVGEKEENNVRYITILVPGMENPFFSLTPHYKKTQIGDVTYYGVCIGIDQTGEFFCIF